MNDTALYREIENKILPERHHGNVVWTSGGSVFIAISNLIDPQKFRAHFNKLNYEDKTKKGQVAHSVVRNIITQTIRGRITFQFRWEESEALVQTL